MFYFIVPIENLYKTIQFISMNKIPEKSLSVDNNTLSLHPVVQTRHCFLCYIFSYCITYYINYLWHRLTNYNILFILYVYIYNIILYIYIVFFSSPGTKSNNEESHSASVDSTLHELSSTKHISYFNVASHQLQPAPDSVPFVPSLSFQSYNYSYNSYNNSTYNYPGTYFPIPSDQLQQLNNQKADNLFLLIFLLTILILLIVIIPMICLYLVQHINSSEFVLYSFLLLRYCINIFNFNLFSAIWYCMYYFFYYLYCWIS